MSIKKLVTSLGKDSERGLTLIEILMVVVILGILTAVAIPSLFNFVDKARYAEASAHLRAMAVELSAFQLEHGYFPPDVGRNRKPKGITFFPLQASGEVPFDSSYDYENWTKGGANNCYVQITFFGRNGKREYPANNTTIYENAKPGLYEYTDRGGDDLVYYLGIHDQSVPCK